MASSQDVQVLAGDGTLSPLPRGVKKGIIATGILGLTSFISCGLLFIYISYRLLAKHSSRSNTTQALDPEKEDVSRLAPKMQPDTSDLRKTSRRESCPRETTQLENKTTDSNSFLTLIHNLLLADMLQAFSFVLGLNWWREDGIFVSSGSCGAQSFLVMVGSVSISVFLIAISINTFLTIVWGFKLSRTAVRSLVAFNWFFSFSLAFAGLGVNLGTRDHRDEDLYARSIALCWINHKYTPNFGMWLQNFWLVLAIAVTIVCYLWIFIALVRNKQSLRHMPPTSTRNNAPLELSGHHPAFLIYPVIYLITTVPISLVGLLATSGSVKVSTEYFNLVSSISSLAGFLDAILWSTTILFSSSKALKEVGLDAYDFMRTPSREYGNIVWVEGAARNQGQHRSRDAGGRWWRLHSDAISPHAPGVDASCDSDGGNMNGIHMDTITSVQVESTLMEPMQAPDSPHPNIPKAYHRLW